VTVHHEGTKNTKVIKRTGISAFFGFAAFATSVL